MVEIEPALGAASSPLVRHEVPLDQVDAVDAEGIAGSKDGRDVVSMMDSLNGAGHMCQPSVEGVVDPGESPALVLGQLAHALSALGRRIEGFLARGL